MTTTTLEPKSNGHLAEVMTPGTTPATAPLVPDDAPFNPAQRQWLNGFLTGLTVVARAANRPQPNASADAPAAPLSVCYGSQSGNCEALSKDLRKHARTRGFDPKITELNDLDFEALAQTAHLLILTSTFGEGDPPDNARLFYDRLMSAEAPSLPASVNYSVCGLGDASYTHYNKCAKDIDARLAGLGATRAADLVTCDVAYEEDYTAWKTGVFDSEPFAAAAGAATPAPSDPSPSADPLERYNKHTPYPATVLEVRCLNGAGSSKEVNHVVLCLAGSGLDYQPGDVLGLWPVNSAAHVDEVLAAAGLTGHEPVQIKGQTLSVRAAMLSKLDLGVCTTKTVAAMGIEAPADAWAGYHLIDVVERFKPTLTPQQLADTLRPLQPRLYSIASSPKAHPGEVHLTVGAVRYTSQGRSRQGVASTFLADRCGVGATVGVYLQKSPHFHLPPDDAPLIMIGPGTGIAPFRAFLEERRARGATGRNWLLFGDQHQATDFLYRRELENHVTDGLLTRLDTAWSRDQAEKVYVQDKMRDAGAELLAWLEAGAFIYVCGDASRMAKDVDRALHEIVAEHGGLGDEAAQHYIQGLKDQHRYQRDVY